MNKKEYFEPFLKNISGFYEKIIERGADKEIPNQYFASDVEEYNKILEHLKISFDNCIFVLVANEAKDGRLVNKLKSYSIQFNKIFKKLELNTLVIDMKTYVPNMLSESNPFQLPGSVLQEFSNLHDFFQEFTNFVDHLEII